MKAQLVFLAVAGLCLTAGADETDKTKADLKQMQGEWRIASVEADGQNVTNELASQVLRDVLVRIEKDKIALVSSAGSAIVSTELILNAEAIPKAADFKPTEDTLGVFNGESMWGIYELAKDELKICVSTNTAIKQRPVEFKTQPGSEVYLVTLKRMP
jgi:uncharacterized protein (TIGR03067 family)